MNMSLMDKALQKAVDEQNVLFPHAAMSILTTVYGKRLDNYRPETIAKKIVALCMKNGYHPHDLDVIIAVNDFIRA